MKRRAFLKSCLVAVTAPAVLASLPKSTGHKARYIVTKARQQGMSSVTCAPLRDLMRTTLKDLPMGSAMAWPQEPGFYDITRLIMKKHETPNQTTEI